jgi:hypothetical protein
MRKTKKLFLFFAVGLTLLSPVISMLPPIMESVSAAEPKNGTWWSTASVDERVEMYLYIMAATNCVKSASDDKIDASKIADGDFYGDNSLGRPDYATNAGHFLTSLSGTSDSSKQDGDDGKMSCSGDEGKAWMQDFVDLLSSTGVVSQKTGISDSDGDMYATACYLGWDRDGRSSSQSLKDCAGDGDKAFRVPKDDAGFRKRLTSDLAGVSTTAPHGLLNAADLYYLYSQTLLVGCVTTKGDRIGYYDDASQTDKSNADSTNSESNYYKLKVIGDDFQPKDFILKGDNPREDNKIISTTSSLSKWNPNCSEILKLANDQAPAAAAYLQANQEQAGIIANLGGGLGGDPTTAGLDDAGASSPETSCGGFNGIANNPLNWLACAALAGMTEAASQLDNFIMGMLCVSEQDIFGDADTCAGATSAASGSSDSFHDAWSVFRTLALGLLVIGGLIMIVSQALGFEFIDAYTIKKVLPRILLAAIGISLSWEILSFLVSLSNGLGIGIRSLIYGPFTGNSGEDFQVILGGGTAALSTLFAAGAFVSLGALGLLSFVGTAFLAILIAFIVLVIRNILVILLILAAPVAIAAYILPNTEKYYKIWWEWLFKALMVFPIITAMIAIGHVFAAITSEKGGAFTSFIAVAAYFAPYFLIPAAFRFAGGALATIGGFANDRSRGGFDRLKRFRGNKAAENMQKVKNFDRFSERSKFGRGVNTMLGAAANPTSMLGGMAGVNARRTSGQAVQGADFWKNNQVVQANQFDDNFLLAVANKNLAQQKLAGAQQKYNAARSAGDSDGMLSAQTEIAAREKGIRSAEQLPIFQRGNRSVRAQALDSLTKTGYQFSVGEDGYRELDSTVRDIAGADEQARVQMMDSSQYNIRASGGRFDLGGINHGSGYDFETGVNKGSGYTAGQGKLETYKAGAAHYLGKGSMKGSKTLEGPALTQYIADNVTNGTLSHQKVAEWHEKLMDSEHSATGGNKVEIVKQREAIEAAVDRSSGFSPSMRSENERLLQQSIEKNKLRGRQPFDEDHINHAGSSGGSGGGSHGEH